MPLLKKPRTKYAHLPPLERPYMWLSKSDPPVTGEDFTRHCYVSGMTGSGKTSSSGKEILKALMSNGGGIVACSKGGPDGDAALVQLYAAELGITDRIIELKPHCKYSLDFLQYAAELSGEMYAILLPSLITTLMEVGARRNGQNYSDDFWRTAPLMLSRAMCTLAVLATEGKPSLPLLEQILLSAPNSVEEVADPAFREQSACMQLLRQAEANARRALADGDPDPMVHYRKTADYFGKRWPRIPERTRESIAISWEASIEVMLVPPLKSLLASGEITVRPEWTYERNSIIVIDYPTLEMDEIGVFANACVLYLWMMAVRRRHAKRTDPICWAFLDEIQEYLHPPTMARFQAICRSRNCSVIALSQNIDTLLALGGSDHQIYSWLQNFGMFIAHANSGKTCEWFADLVGMDHLQKSEYSFGHSDSEDPDRAPGTNRNISMSTTYEYLVPPGVISRELRTGGTRNNGACDAMILMPSRQFKANNGQNWLHTTFIQDWALG